MLKEKKTFHEAAMLLDMLAKAVKTTYRDPFTGAWVPVVTPQEAR